MDPIQALQNRLQAAVQLLPTMQDEDRKMASSAQAAAVKQQCLDASAQLSQATSVVRADLVELAMKALWEPADRSTVIRALLVDPGESPMQARARAHSPATSTGSGSEGVDTGRDKRQRRVMQVYMPQALEYFTNAEWNHMFSPAASQLLRMHIIFSKLTALGAFCLTENCRKTLAAVLLLLVYGRDAHRVSAQTRASTQEFTTREWRNWRKRPTNLQVQTGFPHISTLPLDPAELRRVHRDVFDRAFSMEGEGPTICRLNLDDLRRMCSTMVCRNTAAQAMLYQDALPVPPADRTRLSALPQAALAMVQLPAAHPAPAQAPHVPPPAPATPAAADGALQVVPAPVHDAPATPAAADGALQVVPAPVQGMDQVARLQHDFGQMERMRNMAAAARRKAQTRSAKRAMRIKLEEGVVNLIDSDEDAAAAPVPSALEGAATSSGSADAGVARLAPGAALAPRAKSEAPIVTTAPPDPAAPASQPAPEAAGHAPAPEAAAIPKVEDAELPDRFDAFVEIEKNRSRIRVRFGPRGSSLHSESWAYDPNDVASFNDALERGNKLASQWRKHGWPLL